MSNLTVTQEYIENFVKANNTFLYQLVYDPLKRKLRPLHDYPQDVDPTEMTYAGPYLFLIVNCTYFKGQRSPYYYSFLSQLPYYSDNGIFVTCATYIIHFIKRKVPYVSQRFRM